MIERLIAEATEYEFKEKLEVRKAKNWLKSVSAFANGIGGTLFIGITDEHNIIGLKDIQKDAEKISELIKTRISPMPQVIVKPFIEKGKNLLAVQVLSGRATPYYYKGDGHREAYVRIGNESVAAPEHIVNELILKGTNQSFDGMLTMEKRLDYSFTYLEATYRQQTGLKFEPSDYESFGLADHDGFLTNAGKLMADQPLVYNARIFCTRWNGLSKGSIFDDALDDKEYSGNLIYLLKCAVDFIKNNSHVRFVKTGTSRIDKPDYAQRAVTEALVNALIHRDYILAGAEIHIDMYDDRLEITSPGGMWYGQPIQNWNLGEIGSYRRNPVIADLFHRMRFMERRGSGIGKIISETKKIPGYQDQFRPSFHSDAFSFRVVLKNINYPEPDEENTQETEKIPENNQENKNVPENVPETEKIPENVPENMPETEKIPENMPEIEKIPENVPKSMEDKIIKILQKNPEINRKTLSNALGLSTNQLKNYFKKLSDRGFIRHEGPTKGGKWIVLSPEADLMDLCSEIGKATDEISI